MVPKALLARFVIYGSLCNQCYEFWQEIVDFEIRFGNKCIVEDAVLYQSETEVMKRTSLQSRRDLYRAKEKFRPSRIIYQLGRRRCLHSWFASRLS